MLHIYAQFNDFQQDFVNEPAEYNLWATGCTLTGSIEDIPSEGGGDVDYAITIVYDENCNPSISSVVGFCFPPAPAIEASGCWDWHVELISNVFP